MATLYTLCKSHQRLDEHVLVLVKYGMATTFNAIRLKIPEMLRQDGVCLFVVDVFVLRSVYRPRRKTVVPRLPELGRILLP